MRRIVATLLVAATPLSAAPSTLEKSSRPIERPAISAEGFTQVATLAPLTRSMRPLLRPVAPREEQQIIPIASNPSGYTAWVQDFKRRARSGGISALTLQRAFANAEYVPRVIELDRNQSEFTKTLWDYLSTAASDSRVTNGRAALRKYHSTLSRIERRYGVPKEIVVAIWGLETNYGTFRGGNNVISALSTLAYDGRRASYFESELMNALRILQAGDVPVSRMEGSWAGAMGHTQFMPSSFLQYAVDYTGDGRRDIWSDDPTDALASAANYLRSHGWTTGMPWGMEVTLPSGFDYSQTGHRIRKSAREWEAMGVRRVGGGRLADNGTISILVPAGAGHVALAVYKNFRVIERYNPADAYVIGVGHLADRLGGASKFQGGWPEGDRALTRAERREVQSRLTALGFSTGGVDGRIGPKTLAAVRAYQKSSGQVADGYVSMKLLERLR